MTRGSATAAVLVRPYALTPTAHPESGIACTRRFGCACTGSILVVESDPGAGQTLLEQLANDGFHSEVARSAEHARVLAGRRTPRLVVLGELDSSRAPLKLLEEIRHAARPGSPWAPQTPVIMLGTSLDELDMLRAFETGADDFIARPPRYLELRARILALLRRVEFTAAPTRRIAVGPLGIDLDGHAVSMYGLPVRLRRLEFELLTHLAADPERVFAKHELLRAVWGYRSSGSTRTVDSHASRLRRKLEEHGGRWVINVWGVGYRLR